MCYTLDNTYCCPNSYNDVYPISNVRYNGDKLKVDANVNTTGTLCFVGGVAVGAILTYYLLNKLKEDKKA